MNIKEEITKHRLLSNYSPNKTLRENIESLNNVDKDMGENVLPALARSFGKKILPALDDIVKFGTQRNKGVIMITDNAAQGGVRAAKNGEDLLAALKGNSINAKNLARVNIGMFKAAGVSDDILKTLASDVVKQSGFIKQYSQLAKSPAKLKILLRQKGYSDAGADALIAEIKATKGWGGVAKTTTKTTTKTGKTAAGGSVTLKPTIGAIGTLTRNATNALINGVRNLKWNWLRILKWGAGLGLTAAALWWACWNLDLFPEGIPESQPKDDKKTDDGTQGGGNTGGGSMYSPCKSFPMAYGCKSDQIREVQSCLGFEQKFQTGNFGPITMRGLGGLKELTKEKYDEIIAKCKGTTVTPSPQVAPTPEVVTTAPVTTAPVTTAPVTTDTSTLPPITPPPVPEEPVMDKNKLQELLSSNNLTLRRNGKVIVWRGPKLSGPDFYILSKSLQDKGYTEVRQRETGVRGDEDITMKYKWKKLSK